MILGCAVRYALSRGTYIVSVVCEEIESGIENLSRKETLNIIKDIESAFEEGRIYNSDYIKNTWIRILEILKNKVGEEQSNKDNSNKEQDSNKDNSNKEQDSNKEQSNRSRVLVKGYESCPICGKNRRVFRVDSISYIKCCDSYFMVGYKDNRIVR